MLETVTSFSGFVVCAGWTLVDIAVVVALVVAVVVFVVVVVVVVEVVFADFDVSVVGVEDCAAEPLSSSSVNSCIVLGSFMASLRLSRGFAGGWLTVVGGGGGGCWTTPGIAGVVLSGFAAIMGAA